MFGVFVRFVHVRLHVCVLAFECISTCVCVCVHSRVYIRGERGEVSLYIPGGPQKTEQSIFLVLFSDQQLSFLTLLDRAFYSHYNNTKIITFG